MPGRFSLRALEARCHILQTAQDRARAVQLLAPVLRPDRDVDSVVAMLTVADVFPKSRRERRRLGRAVLGYGNNVDEIATALCAWLERGKTGPWIVATLRDPSSPARHAARRASFLSVGGVSPFQGRVAELVDSIARHREVGEAWPSELELSDRARRLRFELVRKFA